MLATDVVVGAEPIQDLLATAAKQDQVRAAEQAMPPEKPEGEAVRHLYRQGPLYLLSHQCSHMLFCHHNRGRLLCQSRHGREQLWCLRDDMHEGDDPRLLLGHMYRSGNGPQ